ncbi:MAG: glycoside hydrolase family 19 protein [Acidobacteriota bacterium]
MLTDGQLQQIMPTLSAAKREQYLPFLNAIMPMYEIDSPLRVAAFLAQIAHESGELKFWEEIWGPTAAQKRYEPPSDLAKRLGNTQPGDGKRYKGRGPIQITGRFNYRKYGGLLGVDLEGNPDMAATTQIGLQVAGEYWKTNGLNELADIPDFTTITKRINGGLNGLASRQKYYERAKQAIGVGTSFGSFGRAALSAAPPDDDSPLALPRGQEAIDEITGNSSGGSSQAAAKKKSANKSARKAVAKVVVKKAAKKMPVESARPVAKKSAKKAVNASAKSTAKKAVKKVVKKAAGKAAKKVAKKAAKKVVKKAAKKRG